MRKLFFSYLILYSLQLTGAKAQEVCNNCLELISFENIYIAFQDYYSSEKIPSSSIIYVDYREEQDTSIFTITYDLDISEMLQSGKFPECYSVMCDVLVLINSGDFVTIKDSLYLKQIIKLANTMSAQERTLVNWNKRTFTQKNSDDDNSYFYTPLIWKYKVYNSKILKSVWSRESMYQDNYKLALKYIPEEFFE